MQKNPPPPPRERVIAFLEFIVSGQHAKPNPYGATPDETVAALCRLWFNEIYTPGSRYLECVKGDRSEQAARDFISHFSESEYEALERFHHFFELRIDMLPKGDGGELGLQTLVENGLWGHVVKDAWQALKNIKECKNKG